MQLETGYQIWDFRGKPLYKLQKEKFYMFLWRPRPPTLLSKDKVKEIKKNLKEYATEFSKQDELRENKALRMVVERRRALMDEWNAFRASAARRYEAVRGIGGQRNSGAVAGSRGLTVNADLWWPPARRWPRSAGGWPGLPSLRRPTRRLLRSGSRRSSMRRRPLCKKAVDEMRGFEAGRGIGLRELDVGDSELLDQETDQLDRDVLMHIPIAESIMTLLSFPRAPSSPSVPRLAPCVHRPAPRLAPSGLGRPNRDRCKRYGVIPLFRFPHSYHVAQKQREVEPWLPQSTSASCSPPSRSARATLVRRLRAGRAGEAQSRAARWMRDITSNRTRFPPRESEGMCARGRGAGSRETSPNAEAG